MAHMEGDVLIIGDDEEEDDWIRSPEAKRKQAKIDKIADGLLAKEEDKKSRTPRVVRWLVDSVKALVPAQPVAAPVAVEESAPAAAAHGARRVVMPCPLEGCGGQQVDCYDDHGGLCVCVTCGATFDPSVEVAGDDA